MAVPFPNPFDILRPALPLILVIVALLLAIKILPSVLRRLRQRAYDQVIEGETTRLEIVIGRGRPGTVEAAVALIRGLHPGRRMGAQTWWPLGWPAFELRTVWRNGKLLWQIDGGRQLLRLAEACLTSLYPGIEVRDAPRREAPAVWSAVAKLRMSSSWPLGDPSLGGSAVLSRLATLLSSTAAGAEVRLRVLGRPIDPKAWQRALYPETVGRSIAGYVAQDIIDTIFDRQRSDGPPQSTVLSPLERDAQQRKRAGRLGFEVGLVLEVAGTDPKSARDALREVVEFTTSLGDGHQAIDWQLRQGAVATPRRFQLGDWEVAQLWYLPDAPFEAARLPRERPLAPPAPIVRSGPALTIGETRSGPLQLPIASLARHMALVGSTGSGKSTLLLNLALGVLDTPIGATVIDPHGDLANDILSRIPPRHADRVHVLRLADRTHPRGFNFLERREPDQAQLVASEFVGLFQDLWPDYTGPKMQHYLRHALLTLLSHPEPQTILEVVRLLTDDEFRGGYLDYVDDAMLQAFWRNEWPKPGAREHDTSIKAVLNKLGAFVSYHSIRDVVGQGRSTIRPRSIMDAGDLLVVDLSRVGPDNARLFGAMLISRYYIDAVGRQGTALDARRQHLLIVDEVPMFDTRALIKIHDEGRKFGLVLVTAAQSFKSLGERLRDSVLTNAGVIGAMRLGVDDAYLLRRLFDPLTAEDLLSLPAFEIVLRMPSRDGAEKYQGRVCLPAPGDPSVAAAVVAASDRRDARPVDEVRAEVRRREGGERLLAAGGQGPGGSVARQRDRDRK
jgi:energy-coupling factor transporter ATP-binding protein EcfA2